MDLVNTYLSYRLVKLLSTQFSKWEACKRGVIDDKGNILKTPETRNEKKSFTSFERIILKIKKAITSLTGHSRAAAILSTIVLLKDEYQLPIYNYLLREEVIMPNNIVKSFAEKTGKSVDRVEELWNKAKEIVDKQYPSVEKSDDKYYQLVVGVLKKSLGLKEESFATDLPIIDQPINVRKPDGYHQGVAYFDVDFEDMNVTNVLNGRERYKRWREFIKDRGIHTWANKNFKPFSIRTKNGIFFRMR